MEQHEDVQKHRENWDEEKGVSAVVVVEVSSLIASKEADCVESVYERSHNSLGRLQRTSLLQVTLFIARKNVPAPDVGHENSKEQLEY